jgi:hypothetical protein
MWNRVSSLWRLSLMDLPCFGSSSTV